MNDILQIIGSVASIAGIPLAIYLFLRSQAQKYVDIRKDIVNRLSFQIGEGRQLSIFEVQAMISSRVRQNRIQSGVIEADQVVEDLVTEIVNSPLLESTRKEEVITQLRNLHSLGRLYRLVASDPDIFERFSDFLSTTRNEEDGLDNIEDKLNVEITTMKRTQRPETPELFGVLAALLSLIIGTVSIIASIINDSDSITNESLREFIY